jgi:tRNA threonylcarbamoyladenosine biosynthesis protein TsaB
MPVPRPLLLALETSGREGSLALSGDEVDSLERQLPAEGRRHAQTLVAAMRTLLDDAGVRPTDVAVVAASVGPGSYTGLRIGVVAAKTFAYATGCRLVAIDTFDVVAAGLPAEVDRAIVLDDAQRGDLFVARYERVADSAMRRVGPIEIESATAWFDRLQPGEIVVGPGCERFRDRLIERCVRPAASLDVPRAANMHALAWERFDRGEFEDPMGLVPRYLRRSSAEVKWDRERSATDLA